MIFISGHLTALDDALVTHVRQIDFAPPSVQEIKIMFCSYLDRFGGYINEFRGELVNWVEEVATSLKLSSSELGEIYRNALPAAIIRDQRPPLKYMIDAFIRKTGRSNEWDFVIDSSQYSIDQDPQGPSLGEVAELMGEVFGSASRIPDDGRVSLPISESFWFGIPLQSALSGVPLLAGLTEQLKNVGDLQVVDWGWPKGLWKPTEGCVYRPRLQSGAWATHGQTPTETPWQTAGFTLGLRKLVDSEEHGAARTGNPWRRLV